MKTLFENHRFSKTLVLVLFSSFCSWAGMTPKVVGKVKNETRLDLRKIPFQIEVQRYLFPRVGMNCEFDPDQAINSEKLMVDLRVQNPFEGSFSIPSFSVASALDRGQRNHRLVVFVRHPGVLPGREKYRPTYQMEEQGHGFANFLYGSDECDRFFSRMKEDLRKLTLVTIPSRPLRVTHSYDAPYDRYSQEIIYEISVGPAEPEYRGADNAWRFNTNFLVMSGPLVNNEWIDQPVFAVPFAAGEDPLVFVQGKAYLRRDPRTVLFKKSMTGYLSWLLDRGLPRDLLNLSFNDSNPYPSPSPSPPPDVYSVSGNWTGEFEMEAPRTQERSWGKRVRMHFRCDSERVLSGKIDEYTVTGKCLENGAWILMYYPPLQDSLYPSLFKIRFEVLSSRDARGTIYRADEYTQRVGTLSATRGPSY